MYSVSNPFAYAAGGAADTPGLLLTSVSSYGGGLAATNLIKGNSIKSDYHGLPILAFIIPAPTSVGICSRKKQEKQVLHFKPDMKTNGLVVSKESR